MHSCTGNKPATTGTAINNFLVRLGKDAKNSESLWKNWDPEKAEEWRLAELSDEEIENNVAEASDGDDDNKKDKDCEQCPHASDNGGEDPDGSAGDASPPEPKRRKRATRAAATDTYRSRVDFSGSSRTVGTE